MSKLSRREKVLLLILCIVLLGYVYYNYILSPQLSNLEAATGRMLGNKIALSALQESEENIDSIKKEIENLRNRSDEFSKNIPDSSRIPDIIVDLKEMIESSGCTAGNIVFNDLSAGGAVQDNGNNGTSNLSSLKINIVKISYQLTGNYDSIIKFITAVENNERKMTIDRLNLIKDPENSELAADVVMDCYYLGNGSAEKVDYPFLNYAAGRKNMFD